MEHIPCDAADGPLHVIRQVGYKLVKTECSHLAHKQNTPPAGSQLRSRSLRIKTDTSTHRTNHVVWRRREDVNQCIIIHAEGLRSCPVTQHEGMYAVHKCYKRSCRVQFSLTTSCATTLLHFSLTPSLATTSSLFTHNQSRNHTRSLFSVMSGT